jgi:hypothetical protein
LSSSTRWTRAGVSSAASKAIFGLLLGRYPEDFSPVFVGIDEIGDLTVGEIAPHRVRGPRDNSCRCYGPINQHQYSRDHAWRLAHIELRAIRGARCSAEIERYEFAFLPKLLRLPSVQWVHNEASKDDKMDSLLKALLVCPYRERAAGAGARHPHHRS